MTTTKEELASVYASLKWLHKQGRLSVDEFHTELVELIDEYVGSEE